ncbi:MAG TPA: hypothetical protein VN797_10040 [Gemmatimonadaceae bacterium]|jgi:hypothetical protein|nr:hypothetical protein [Gemmatimonadaceae bacterium]
MIRSVLLTRSLCQEATISVEAETEAEAREIAEQRARDSLVAWVVVDEDVMAKAEKT